NRVIVSFGKQQIQGFVVGLKENTEYDISKVKEISSVVEEEPVIFEEMLKLMDFMVQKYHLRKIDVLRLFLPSEMRKDEIKSLEKIICKLNKNPEEIKNKLRKNAKNQIELINYLENNKICEKSFLISEFGAYAVNKFIEENILITEKIIKNREPLFLKIKNKEITFNKEQLRAISTMNKPDKYLLFGVTGSGKTEVYMNLIETALKQNKTAIMLVPEISLTPQIFGKFKDRFGELVAVLHSGLSAGERFDEWKRLFNGEAQIVVGARSAIFAPLKNVGVIIIDEEHDGSYMSESNPRFNAKEVAEFRQEYNNSILVCGSATPELESYKKTETGEYKLVELPTRANGREMPKVQIVDMVTELQRGNSSPFSYALLDELEKVIKNKKQAMIFINRRGFSSFMRCSQCGYVAKCTDCDVTLVYHKDEDKLKCHYCGKRFKALTNCPNCKSENIRLGAVGTQKIVEELENRFNVKVFRMDNDTTNTKNAHSKILSEFGQAKPAILVGTQMIAKGHDFKDVVLVGIIDADQTLYQSNFKSAERTFELISQVAGRAGRSEDEGKVIHQSYSPRHYVYKFVSNYNYKAFYDKEINLREVTKFPPFYKIVRILFSASNEDLVREVAKKCYSDIIGIRNEYLTDFVYLEAMKSPLTRIKNAYRYQILMRISNNREEIVDKIYKVCDKYLNTKVSLFVEINPQNLY
ncbi:MAG: primosomal protein N', partial [Clostridia bacterium]|nr:primosomal protein N' [Clostridia bacterium]